jgi:hypothetical protein
VHSVIACLPEHIDAPIQAEFTGEPLQIRRRSRRIDTRPADFLCNATTLHLKRILRIALVLKLEVNGVPNHDIVPTPIGNHCKAVVYFRPDENASHIILRRVGKHHPRTLNVTNPRLIAGAAYGLQDFGGRREYEAD